MSPVYIYHIGPASYDRCYCVLESCLTFFGCKLVPTDWGAGHYRACPSATPFRGLGIVSCMGLTHKLENSRELRRRYRPSCSALLTVPMYSLFHPVDF